MSTTEKKDTGEAEDNVINTVYTFDKDGNTVSEYVYTEETGNVGGNGEASGINPYSGEGGAGVVSNINNLLVNHNFKDLEGWTSMPTNCGDTEISDFAAETFSKYGGHMLRIHSHNSAGVRNGVYQTTNVLPTGEYTFSSYVEVYYPFSGSESAGAYIRVVTTNGTVLGESEHLKVKDDDFIRLIVPFKIDTAQSVKVEILADGAGVMHANAAQLENNQYANAYNMLENGNFERDTNGWTTSSGAEASTAVKFNMSKSLKLTGNISGRRYAYQKIVPKTSRSTRETFTLSGWAEGYGLVDRKREYAQLPTFRLRAVIKYSDNSVDPQPYIAQFSPCTEGWQFASVQFSKSDYKKIKDITVYCDYDYNFGNATVVCKCFCSVLGTRSN